MATATRKKAPRRIADAAEGQTPVDLGGGLELRFVEVNDLREQDVNARNMTNEMFERLQTTIGRDGRLESLPFCAETERGIEIVSGHHRVRAARAAGLPTVPVVVDVTGLSRAKIKAKQLAHNAIAGADDEDMLARIYESIDDMEARLEAFIDESQFSGPIEAVSVPGLGISLETRTAVIAFLPYQAKKFRDAVHEVAATLDADEVYLAELKKVDEFREIADEMRKSYDVRALGAVLAVLSDVLATHLGKKPERQREDWIPLVDIGGGRTAMVPPDTAGVLEELLATVRSARKSKSVPLHEALAEAARAYLGKKPE